MSRPAETIDDARSAFDRHAWREAYARYREADAESPLPPQDLERLGEASWWISRIEDCLEARERAYTAYLEAGDKAGAARTAVWLARDNFGLLRTSTGRGWFRTAARLLEGEPEGPAHAYLEQLRAHIASVGGDLEASIEHARRAVDLAARFGDRDIEARALTNLGGALVARGDVEEGMAHYDEATVAAVSGELSPMATGIVYCNTIGVCADQADYRRASEWTDAARRWCERQSISGFPGLCRVHRAEISRLRGAWTEAEREARVACEELTEHGLPMFAADGFYEIGEIRLRVGDLDGAREAFRQAHELGRDPEPGAALLHLAEGRPDVAAAAIRRAVEDAGEPLKRVRFLPAAVEVALARGDLNEARAAVKDLEEIAASYGSGALRAWAAACRAGVRLAEGDASGAARDARDAFRLWTELDAPYEAALARVRLAEAYRASPSSADEEAASVELRAARAAFERLGAVPDARRATELLGEEPDARPARPVVRTFMFTDIVGSTSLIEAIGDDAWEDLRRWHDRSLRACFAAHGGEEVDHPGDGFFISFEDVGPALDAAIAIQRLLGEHRRTHGFAPSVRIGVHVAEARADEEGYTGRGVHAAARIGAQAGPGEILASDATVAAADGDYRAGEPREVILKGITAPVLVRAVAWE